MFHLLIVFIFSGIVNHRFSMIMKREWIDVQALSSFLHVELLRLGTTIFKRRYGYLVMSLLSDYLYHISGNGICRFSTDWYYEMECKLSRVSSLLTFFAWVLLVHVDMITWSHNTDCFVLFFVCVSMLSFSIGYCWVFNIFNEVSIRFRILR